VDLGDMGAKTVELLEKDKGKAKFIKADVTNTDDVKMIIETAQREFGGVHALVNCVAKYGSGMAKSVGDTDEKDWNDVINVNLNGYFKMRKYAIPAMQKSGSGAIVNISSLAAFTSLPNISVYSVTKAAINAMTRSIAVDYAPTIRANTVCPGFVKIANSENNRTPEQLEAWYKDISKQYPMRRVCEVEEIANVVSFLVSDKASYINGQSIIVDGGKIVADTHDF
jgi:NAD(P)-dependent dehydrogenase (short-subunit alcohol dehydrogenase family)